MHINISYKQMIMQCGPLKMKDDNKAKLEFALSMYFLFTINLSSLFTIDNLFTDNHYLTFSHVCFIYLIVCKIIQMVCLICY